MDNETMLFVANYIFPLLGIFITMAAQLYIKANYNNYKDYPTKSHLNGYETAKKILEANGLSNIKIKMVAGDLSDHYDPTTKTVSLSTKVYSENSIASVSVAAHECGHALQDKEGYKFLKIRRSLVPLVNFSSKFGYIVVVLGLILGVLNLAKIGIYILLIILLFQLVTLPVEFNASKRALIQLDKLAIVDQKEKKGSKKMLTSAALTYVASLMSTMLQILRLALMVFGRRDD